MKKKKKKRAKTDLKEIGRLSIKNGEKNVRKTQELGRKAIIPEEGSRQSRKKKKTDGTSRYNNYFFCLSNVVVCCKFTRPIRDRQIVHENKRQKKTV